MRRSDKNSEHEEEAMVALTSSEKLNQDIIMEKRQNDATVCSGMD